MLIQIKAEELRKALKDIEQAEKNGFMFCEAVFNQTYKDSYWVVGTYSDLWEKADPTNGSLNWGRGQNVTKTNTFKDGKLIPTKETKKRIENYPENDAIDKGKIGKYKYWIVEHRGSLNGYVGFPKRPTIEQGYNGILTYVPVHGGITYAREGKLGMVYGFDTKHCDSEEYPINDINWIKKECKKMINGILMAKKLEKRYLLSTDENEKADICQQVFDTSKDKDSKFNFGININLLSGKL